MKQVDNEENGAGGVTTPSNPAPVPPTKKPFYDPTKKKQYLALGAVIVFFALVIAHELGAF